MNERHLELLHSGYTLVAASHRLARRLQFSFARRQTERGVEAWPSPDILHWQAWLQRCWDYHAREHTDTVLLNEWQEQLLWQRVINESGRGGELMQPAHVARRVMEAWNLLHRYRIPIFPGDVAINEDARAFRNWAVDFRKLCDANGWCDGGSLIDVLGRSINRPVRIALFGFERITPDQQLLINAIESAGGSVVVADHEHAGRNRRVDIRPGADAGEEISAAANWSRQLLESNRGASIGIVVPQLETLRSEVERRFADCLCPGALVEPAAAGPPSFSLSLGKPLSEYPLIDTAFTLLRLGQASLPLADLGALLRSPWVGGYETERLDRAMLDAALRDHGDRQPSVDSILYVADRALDADRQPGCFLDALRQAGQYLRGLPGSAPPVAWAQAMTRLLALFGWPGDRTLASGDYQALKAWQEVLNRFVSMQLVESAIGYDAAVNRLRRIATALGFQPETEETPIQILGLAGAADMAFDHLWVMGLHEENWPPPARPNPFIPLALQSRHGLPGATAELVLEESRRRLMALVRSAPDVVLSYPRHDKDRTLRPSPLLKPWAGGAVPEQAGEVPDYAARMLAAGRLDTLNDEQAPPPAGGHAAGGTALFRDQSACPFRAFARHRLRAGGLDEVDIGLRPRDRGLILHRLMQRLWQRLETQQRLIAMAADERDRLIDEVIGDVLAAERRRSPRVWTDRFTGLEKARLGNLLREWLQLEAQRSPFRVVACEQEQQINIDAIEANTRIDRVDRLADEREVIIDYKTGEANVNEWLGERPDDPQLPLYAVTRGECIAAVAFGRLKRGPGFGFQGLASEAGILPDTRAFDTTSQARQLTSETTPAPGWEDLLAAWKTIVNRLARAFLDGDARVDPKNAQACRFCDQHPLCRIHELQRQPREDDD